MSQFTDKIKSLSAFSASYLKGALGNGFEAIIQGVVSLDPEGASEAQLNVMSEDLRTAALKFAEMSKSKAKEVKEAEVALVLYEKAKSAALAVNAFIQANPTKEADLTPKLNQLIDEAESKKAEYDKEKLEADQVTELVDLLNEILEQKFTAIESAKRALKTAQTRMATEVAKQQSDKMKDEIEAMKAAKTSGLNVALGAMNAKADKIETQRLADQKLRELKKSGDIMQDDEIQAIVNSANGVKAPSVSDRLANL